MFLFPILSTIGTEKTEKRNAPRELEELIFLTGKGDMAAFERLYKETDKAIYGYILSILRRSQDAEDIMQETYLKIRANAKNYEPQGKPLAWIFKIAKNLSLMRLRELKREAPAADEEMLFGLSLPGEMTEEKEVLKKALEILNEQERAIVLLHAGSGYKHREIASALGILLPTVLSKYTRALSKLKIAIKEEK